MLMRIVFTVCVAAFITGAPQASGQDVGAFLLAESRGAVEAPPLVPQATGDELKNPWLAFGLSTLITGGGQVYNEEIEKGIIMFAGSAAGYIILFSGDSVGSGRAYTGWGLLLGTKLWSMIDAPMVASRINEEAHRTSWQVIPIVSPDYAGASLTLRF